LARAPRVPSTTHIARAIDHDVPLGMRVSKLVDAFRSALDVVKAPSRYK
jgi:hypothetical protein